MSKRVRFQTFHAASLVAGLSFLCSSSLSLAQEAVAESEEVADPSTTNTEEAPATNEDTSPEQPAATESKNTAEVATSEANQGEPFVTASENTEATVDPGVTDQDDSAIKSKVWLNVAILGGYSSPVGDLVEGAALNETIKAAIPLGVDVRVLTPTGYMLGAFLHIAPGMSGSSLDGCDSCSLIGGRVGLHAGRHFAPTSIVDPWVSLGVSYEFLSSSRDVELLAVTNDGDVVTVDGSRTITASTLPEVLIQVGMDLGTKDIRIGPYGFASWGRFGSVESKVRCDALACAGQDFTSNDEIDSSRKASHFWLGGGLRAAYNL